MPAETGNLTGCHLEVLLVDIDELPSIPGQNQRYQQKAVRFRDIERVPFPFWDIPAGSDRQSQGGYKYSDGLPVISITP